MWVGRGWVLLLRLFHTEVFYFEFFNNDEMVVDDMKTLLHRQTKELGEDKQHVVY